MCVCVYVHMMCLCMRTCVTDFFSAISLKCRPHKNKTEPAHLEDLDNVIGRCSDGVDRRLTENPQEVGSISLQNPLLDGLVLTLFVDNDALLCVLRWVVHVHLHEIEYHNHTRPLELVTRDLSVFSVKYVWSHVICKVRGLTFKICSMPWSAMSESRFASRQRRNMSSSILSSCSSS